MAIASYTNLTGRTTKIFRVKVSTGNKNKAKARNESKLNGLNTIEEVNTDNIRIIVYKSLGKL